MTSRHKKIWLIGIIFLLGMLLRLYFLPIPNQDEDMLFQEWIGRILKFGLRNVYDPRLFEIDAYHPPLNYYFLWAIGKAYIKFFISSLEQFRIESIALMQLIKIPNLIFDLLIALIIFLVVLRYKNYKMAVWALCFYIFNPAMIWEAGYIGQIESTQAILMLLAIVFLAFDKIELSWLAITVGILTKVQCVILFPLIIFFSIVKFPIKRVLNASRYSLIAAIIILLPWISHGQVFNVLDIYTNNTIDTYPFTTLNAGNIWGLWGTLSDDGFIIGFAGEGRMTFISDSYSIQHWPFFSYKQLGLSLFAIWYIIAILCIFKKRDKVNLYQVSSLICFAFFMLPTQMTERYLFPFFPLYAIIIMFQRKNLMLYIAASISFFLNLYMTFPLARASPWVPLSNPNNPDLYHFLALPLDATRSLTVLVSLLNLGLLLLLTFYTLNHSFNITKSFKHLFGAQQPSL